MNQQKLLHTFYTKADKEMSSENKENLEIISSLLRDVSSEKISVQYFCSHYERLFNFKLNKKLLSEYEKKIYNDLFDKVVWYSPFIEERRKIPNYLDESTIIDSVNKLLNLLNER